MADFEVTSPGVHKLLASLDIKKSTGPDDLSPRVLKEASDIIAPILTTIFNQSLKSGSVPKDWRLANVFPLHKKGPKDLPENYRPISLTSVCSKLLEHIVYSSISKFLESNGLSKRRRDDGPDDGTAHTGPECCCSGCCYTAIVVVPPAHILLLSRLCRLSRE
jgi:hypothetical protein